MKKGKIIVIEGACDGIGKTTQFNMLKERLEREGKSVITHHFPSYNTPQGADVEKYLRGEFGNPEDLDPYFIHSLYAKDRQITWENLLKPEIELGHIVLLDRYTTSSIIYQSSTIKDWEERKKFIDFVCENEYHERRIGEPDKILFLYAPFEVITKTRQSRKTNDGIENDIHERNYEFMRGVYENAMQVSEYLNWDRIDCSAGDHLDTIENIHEKIYQKVKTL